MGSCTMNELIMYRLVTSEIQACLCNYGCYNANASTMPQETKKIGLFPTSQEGIVLCMHHHGVLFHRNRGFLAENS